jgi:hypothetical protein
LDPGPDHVAHALDEVRHGGESPMMSESRVGSRRPGWGERVSKTRGGGCSIVHLWRRVLSVGLVCKPIAMSLSTPCSSELPVV